MGWGRGVLALQAGDIDRLGPAGMFTAMVHQFSVTLRRKWLWLVTIFSLIGIGGLAVRAEEKIEADGFALLRGWTPPVYPAAELKARHSGMVNVRCVIDETGRVTSARALEDSDAAFIQTALDAVKRWTFAPATSGGKPVACCLDTLVAFSPARGQQKPSAVPPQEQTFNPAPRTSPSPKSTPPGDYPAALVERRLQGAVRFACLVTADGRPANVKIVAASHVDFVLPALRSLEHWEFTPGMQGDLPVPSEIEGLVSFEDIVKSSEETLAANGLAAAGGSMPSVHVMPVSAADPVWPIDALLAGESGSATVEFTIGESGFVSGVKVREATQPAFGAALAAAIRTWVFERPLEKGRGTTVAMIQHYDFKAAGADAAESDPGVRVLNALRRGEIHPAKGLDGKLTPLYRVRPEYPDALRDQGSPAGQAEIEFVIDREGRVRLPRIVSASNEEFGWAAATAVAQWVFSAPLRGGEPVDVKVHIPFNFAAPTQP